MYPTFLPGTRCTSISEPKRLERDRREGRGKGKTFNCKVIKQEHLLMLIVCSIILTATLHSHLRALSVMLSSRSICRQWAQESCSTEPLTWLMDHYFYHLPILWHKLAARTVYLTHLHIFKLLDSTCHIYQKTSSSTSRGSGEGLNTTNRRSFVLLSGGASFFRGGRLTSVWMRGIGERVEKP